MMRTNGNGGGGGPVDRFPNVDLPATDAAENVQDMTFIEEATQNMLADEIDNQPAVEQQPEYPEPVVPQARQQARQQPIQQPTQQPVQRPAQQPAQQPAARQPVQPAQPAQPTPEQQQQERLRSDPFGVQAEQLQQSEQQFVEALAQQVYSVSQEEMDAFLSGDASMVSKALAKVHVNAVGSVMRVISQQMPVWVGHMLRYHNIAGEREGRFWAANPSLNKREHADMALAAARAFRQVNPNADEDTMNRMVGAMVAAAAGIVPQQQRQQQQHQTPGGVRTPGRVVRNTSGAFQPAGMAPAGNQPARVDNPWAQTTDILLADARGAFDDSH